MEKYIRWYAVVVGCRAVAGDVNNAERVQAVRTVLKRLFDRFLFHPELPAEANVD
jgi:hypothetical protein